MAVVSLRRIVLSVVLVSLCALTGALAVGAGSAAAVEFGGEGNGAGQFSVFGGLAAGRNGDVFELERGGNFRVNVFTQSGEFVRAFGWGVVDGAEKLEVCTSSCRAGLQGAGAGEIAGGASGIAVSPNSGNVFIADQSNARVEEFTETGAFVVAFGHEVNASKVAQRQQEEAEAKVSVVTPREQDVCTGNPGSECQNGQPGSGEAAFEFAGRSLGSSSTPISVGVDGLVPVVYVGSNGRVEMFEEDGSYLGASVVENANKEMLGQVEAVAASTGTLTPEVYVIAAGDEHVVEYEETKPQELSVLHELAGPGVLHEFTGTGPEAESLAYDSTSGTVLVEHESHSSDRRLYVYNAAGKLTQAFPTHTGTAEDMHSIMWDALAGEVYLTTPAPRKVRSVSVPPAGALVVSSSAEPGPAGGVRLVGTVDPEGAETKVAFEYESAPGVFTQLSEQTIAGVVGGEANFNEETEDEAGAPLEASAHLASGRTYNYRVRAANGNGVTGPGFTQPAGSFTTLPAAEISSLSVTGVSATAASLSANVNPLNEASSWWLEYVPAGSSNYARTPAQQLPGVDEALQVSAHIDGLLPHTAYRVRLTVANALAKEPAPVHSSEVELVTQSAQPASVSPDGRAWEMVSPVEKHNAGILPIPEQGIIEAASNGSGLAYIVSASTEPSPAGEPSPEDVQVLATHGSDGWSSRDIASPHEANWGASPGNYAEFYGFSPDLSFGLVEPKGGTLLGGATEPSLYIRDNAQCEAEAVPDACYRPLLSKQDVISGKKLSTKGEEVEYHGAATADLSHVVLTSNTPLTQEAVGTKSSVYEWSGGALQLVSVLPEGGGPAGYGSGATAKAGGGSSGGPHSISEDGDRVIWFGGESEAIKHLYMHEAASNRTVQLDPDSEGAGKVAFQGASSNEQYVFFTDGEPLTHGSAATVEAPDLYVYEANPDSDSEPGTLRDLTVSLDTGEPADVLGTVLGVGEDGSYVYFVADGVLAPGAHPGDCSSESIPPANRSCNLYVEHRNAGGWEAPLFIATLSGSDSSAWSSSGFGHAVETAGVSPDGRWLAFTSSRSLTGYDNEDASSEHPGERLDQEVFLYAATSNTLICASCDPMGARPHGEQVKVENLIDSEGQFNADAWVAGAIPGWDSMQGTQGVYQPRYLSDGGRLFFNSTDSLVPQDVNNTTDVYEYEPPGVGSCTTAAETYSPGQAGCIGLISSGISAEESVFLDASENGNDVFFMTSAQLVKGDEDSAYDVYDAHVCGSGWECSAEAAVTPPCSTTSSCRGAPEQQPSVFGAPPSATFSGSGNQPPSSSGGVKKSTKKKTVGCAKGKHRAHGRCARVKRKTAKRRVKHTAAGVRDVSARRDGRAK